MIPHKLHIKNFLSYGPETQIIDFANYHLICLSGKNGHGKSALLDAITWAIWGQARKSFGNAKPDAGLLHLGQKHMMVILEFEVNGANYRVRREFLNTASKPFATLDFGIQDSDGKLTALTDKTIKDTQEKIERTIGITYESFTNSTFLRQGQSNEFSKKLPKERKEILAQILQLNQFEQQKKIALLHTRKLQLDWTAQTNILARIEQELMALATLHEQQQIIAKQIMQLEEQYQIFLSVKKDLALKTQALQQQQNEHFFLTQQYQNIEKNIEEVRKEIIKLQSILQQQNHTIDLKKMKQEEQDLIQKFHILQQAHNKKLQLKEQYLTTKDTLKELTAALQQNFQHSQQKLQLQIATTQEIIHFGQKQCQQEQTLHQELVQQSVRFEKQLALLQTQLQKLHNVEKTYTQLQTLFDKNKSLYQNLSAQRLHLTQQITMMVKQEEEQQKSSEKMCLQCEQSISIEQEHKIIQNLKLKQMQAESELTKITQHMQELKASLTLQHAELEALKISTNEFISVSAKFEEQGKQQATLILQIKDQEKKINAQQEEIIAAQKSMQTLKKDEEFLTKNFEQNCQNNQIQELQKKLQAIEQEAKAINYQPQEHQKIEETLQELQKVLITHQANFDDANKEMMQMQLVQFQKNMHSLEEQQQEIQKKLALFSNLAQQHQEQIEQQQLLEKNLDNLEQTHRQLLVQKGTLQHQQNKQRELEKEQEKITKAIKSLHQEMQDYQEIAKALGKDGIQALLIEQAIPEIEHETNQILSRLTNNQTQIFIESLRDLKKGGSKETLDIKISDSFGLRDYEMFSGGEAFRIDFALRIGISKLLARRAGTTLQTIFIDEGFGSQDEEGLQLIMDNIYKIQDDFAKIVIVSHLPEMKEQFPVQFVIEKKRSGSIVSVIHQG